LRAHGEKFVTLERVATVAFVILKRQTGWKALPGKVFQPSRRARALI
jgi:hypothetical protein